MAKSIPTSTVDQVIRYHLKAKGCSLSGPKNPGETGADIIAKLSETNWFVEVIGFQDHPPIRSREFFEAFFRLISRDRDDSSDVLVLGLPIRFKRGMRQRMRQYGIAWVKLGRTFPNIEIWYADTDKNTVEEYSWLSPID